MNGVAALIGFLFCGCVWPCLALSLSGRGRPGDFLTSDEVDVLVRAQHAGQDSFKLIQVGDLVHLHNTVSEVTLSDMSAFPKIPEGHAWGMDIDPETARAYMYDATSQRLPQKVFCDTLLQPVVRLCFACKEYVVCFHLYVSINQVCKSIFV
jgi:hypothetical protein